MWEARRWSTLRSAGYGSMARGKTVLCGKHGGVQRCEVVGCEHGGGRRCKVAGCGSMARSKTALCGKRGGGRRCEVASCDKVAQGKSEMCCRCENKAKAKQQASKEASKPQVTVGRKQHASDEAVKKLTGDAARRGLRPKSKIASKRRLICLTVRV